MKQLTLMHTFLFLPVFQGIGEKYIRAGKIDPQLQHFIPCFQFGEYQVHVNLYRDKIAFIEY